LTFSINSIAQFHQLAEKYGPKSGDGPTEDQMTNGYFKVISVARDVSNSVFAKATVKARGDPGRYFFVQTNKETAHVNLVCRFSGYLATSIMISEAALALAHDYDQLTDIAKQGGHLTAA
jgi:hypothetical protein